MPLEKTAIEFISLSQNLLRLSQEILVIFNKNSKEFDFRPSNIPAHKNTFLYQIKNSIAQFRSIIILCEHENAETSLIILRALLESLISVRFILCTENLEDITSKNERFERYKWIQMKKLLKYWKESPNVHRKDLK